MEVLWQVVQMMNVKRGFQRDAAVEETCDIVDHCLYKNVILYAESGAGPKDYRYRCSLCHGHCAEDDVGTFFVTHGLSQERCKHAPKSDVAEFVVRRGEGFFHKGSEVVVGEAVEESVPHVQISILRDLELKAK